MGCDERFDDTRSDEQIRRDERRAAREKQQKQAGENFLLRMKRAYLGKEAIPDLLSPWDKLAKGPKMSEAEIEKLKERVATHYTPKVTIDINILRRLLQTFEPDHYLQKLPRVGRTVHMQGSYDTHPVKVVAHLPNGEILAYERGNPHGDGGTKGKMHILSSWYLKPQMYMGG